MIVFGFNGFYRICQIKMLLIFLKEPNNI